jgi:diguanylate cyclase (GGDEF)-like protein
MIEPARLDFFHGAETAGGEVAPRKRVGRWHRRLTAPRVLFLIFAIVVLSVLWLATFNFIGIEYRNADHRALSSSHELLETYEAQVVRVLHEIDQTLKAVQYSFQLRGDGTATLGDLAARDLLPPSLVFTVKVVNAAGEVVATTGEASRTEVLAADFLERARGVDSLIEAPPVRFGDDRRLGFGRRLTAPDGSFGGVAVVEVDAAFFVSGYETSKLGERGVLAILGSDGVFRVRRSGNRVVVGGRTDYGSVVASGLGLGDTDAVLAVNRWDGVRRYTSARELYDHPLAVVVGLSEDERMAAAEERSATYVRRAGAGSVLLVLVLVALGRMSWRFEALRRREIETRAAHARRIEHLAYHDALTGLPNRSFLTKLLESRIRLASRDGSKFALLYLDLDRFKKVNDTLGHEAGDALLREVAGRLQAVLRRSDTVARMGGDEFVILLPVLESEEHAATVAGKVLLALGEPIVLLGQELEVTVSIGIGLFPRDGTDERTLMKNADTAMYEAKDGGRNSFRFFSEEVSAASRESLLLLAGREAAA